MQEQAFITLLPKEILNFIYEKLDDGSKLKFILISQIFYKFIIEKLIDIKLKPSIQKEIDIDPGESEEETLTTDLCKKLLVNYSAIEKLNLVKCNVDLSFLASLTSLRNFEWEPPIESIFQFDKEVILSITNLPSTLTSLTLRKTSLDNLTALSKVTGLVYLDVGFCTFKVSDLTVLIQLNLTTLNLKSCLILQSKDIEFLSNLTTLKNINLDETSVQTISPLLTLTQLEILSLSSCDIPDFDPLTSLINLKNLNLKGCQISDKTLYSLLNKLQNLQYLGVPDFNDTTIQTILNTALQENFNTFYKIFFLYIKELRGIFHRGKLQDYFAQLSEETAKQYFMKSLNESNNHWQLIFPCISCNKYNQKFLDWLIECPPDNIYKLLFVITTLDPNRENQYKIIHLIKGYLDNNNFQILTQLLPYFDSKIFVTSFSSLQSIEIESISTRASKFLEKTYFKEDEKEAYSFYKKISDQLTQEMNFITDITLESQKIIKEIKTAIDKPGFEKTRFFKPGSSKQNVFMHHKNIITFYIEQLIHNSHQSVDEITNILIEKGRYFFPNLNEYLERFLDKIKEKQKVYELHDYSLFSGCNIM